MQLFKCLKNLLIKTGLILLVFAFFSISFSSSLKEFDILIKNVTIIDGTGEPRFKGSIAIKGEKIEALGEIEADAETIIDGKGLFASPGFIDPHSHADLNVLEYPLAENLIMQGITTFVGGNCGLSPAPQKELTFSQWLSKVEEKGISVNMAPLVGHNTIRSLVMGEDFKREATREELEEMRSLLEEAMQSGAFGLSAGIDPPWPGFFASFDEMVELCKLAAEYGGFYTPHTRHERSHWWTDNLDEFSYVLYYGPPEDVWVGRYRGIVEAIEISKQARIPLHVAHIPNAYLLPLPHPDYLEEAAARATMELINKALEEGVKVSCDVVLPPLPQFTQVIVQEFLNSEFNYPEWLAKLKKEELVERLKSREFREKIKELYDKCKIKFSMIHTKVDPYWFECFKVVGHKNHAYMGKTIGEIANEKKLDPLETVFEIVVEDPDAIWLHALDRRYNEVAVATIIQHPLCEPCTDITSAPAKLPQGHRWLVGAAHWGTYPYYIQTYVREKKLLTLEEAVKKATLLPAQRLGIERGVLKPGYFADLVIFDLGRISMKGDYIEPDRTPEGIELVIVNGKIVYREKTHTGAKPGKILRHKRNSS